MHPSIRSVSHRSALSKLSLGMGCAASGCTAQARRRAPWLVIGLLVLTTNACARGPGAQAAVTPDDLAPAPPAIEWQAPVAIASGDADIGPWRMNQSRFHYVDDPAVAVTAAGSAAVIWVDNERKDVFSCKAPGDSRRRKSDFRAPKTGQRNSSAEGLLSRSLASAASPMALARACDYPCGNRQTGLEGARSVHTLTCPRVTEPDQHERKAEPCTN
ncbi:hypothetical protein [Thiohalocapsa halophila]|uniref:hypothetical protein n=1 Tax=Thiohalocapsa halophila TaxID=69359 RepID=UPI001904C9B8|nr:hypothetical protein [Thiohalocapsa halophila]